MLRVRVRCLPVGTYAIPASCKGTVRATATRRPKRLGRAAFTATSARTVTVRLKLSRKVYRSLRGRRRKATLRVSVGTRTATRRILLGRAT